MAVNGDTPPSSSQDGGGLLYGKHRTMSLDNDLQQRNNNEKPPRIKPRINAAPKIRQLYWCDFPKDAHLPEMWKTRPVIIISYKNTLKGTVTVIPCSTQQQTDNPWAVSLDTTIDGNKSWAICDKITTVAVSRLSIHRSSVKRVTEVEFYRILQCIFRWFPQIPS